MNPTIYYDVIKRGEMIFKNTVGKEFTIEELVKEIRGFIQENEDEVYDIIIGTDSLYRAKNTVFVTAIIVHRVGSGGRFFYTKRKINHDIDLSTRLLTETYDSIKLIRKLESTDIFYIVNNVSVHIDAGDNGKSSKIIKECISYVRGFGYEARVKPEACGASTVADKFTK